MNGHMSDLRSEPPVSLGITLSTDNTLIEAL